jgi:hypothetical protein
MALKSKPLDKVRDSVPLADVAAVEPLARINFNVAASTRNRWKAEASSRGISLAQFIIEAIEQRVSK